MVRQAAIDEATFRKRIGSEGTRGRRDVGVFVHRYNTNSQEALFRLARLSVDTQTSIAAVLLTWPSESAIPGDVLDKDAATYSRDYLAHILSMPTRVSAP
jgi:esterase/lipase superfamily enzyme